MAKVQFTAQGWFSRLCGTVLVEPCAVSALLSYWPFALPQICRRGLSFHGQFGAAASPLVLNELLRCYPSSSLLFGRRVNATLKSALHHFSISDSQSLRGGAMMHRLGDFQILAVLTSGNERTATFTMRLEHGVVH